MVADYDKNQIIEFNVNGYTLVIPDLLHQVIHQIMDILDVQQMQRMTVMEIFTQQILTDTEYRNLILL